MLYSTKIKLGISPIGWTNDDLPELGGNIPFEQCVDEMSLAGFTGCEVGSKFPGDTAALKSALELRGLQVCSRWFSTYFTTGPERETVDAFTKQLDFMAYMGAGVIGCSEQGGGIQGLDTPIFGNDKPVFGDGDWDKLISGMRKLGKLAKERGIKCSYHHHMGTGVQTSEEIERFMDGTGGDVYLLFDSGHIYFSEGTQQAVDTLIDKYIGRISHIHLKDVRLPVLRETADKRLSFLSAVKKGVFTVPGDGDISFEHIFGTIRKSGYEGWLLVEAEQDPAQANPLEYAVSARRFIRKQTGL